MQYTFRTITKQQWLNRLFALLMCASLLISSVAAAPSPAQAQAAGATAAAPAAQDAERVNYRNLIVKMKAPGGLQSMAEASALPELNLTPMFPEAAAAGESLGAQSVSTLSTYYSADLGEGATFEQAQQTLDALLQNPQVETAYMAPILAPASNLMATPNDYEPQQTYLTALNVPGATGPTGSKGANVTLVDIEGGWIVGHEDLPISNDNFLPGSVNSSDMTWLNHGTAVLGVVAGRDNTYGVTGIAPDTYIRMISTLGYVSISQAILAATQELTKDGRTGDIILLPVQGLGPRTNTECPAGCDCSTFEYIPVEYWPDVYEAIYAATSAGIIVIEAAGTGAVNLNADVYTNRFNRSVRDSGAILVGAGASDTREPLCNANTGSRIDLQGWGENVVTTGYGDLYMDGDSNPTSFYTSSFGGSSAAAAMVAGAASSLQGVARARGYLLTPTQVRDFLRTTGSAQGGDPVTQHIGPLPNLGAAIDRISDGVDLISPADSADLFTLRPTFDWENYLGASQYQLIVSNNSTFAPLELNITTDASEFTPSVNLAKGQHYWKVRPAINGVWQEWTSNYRTFYIVAGTISTPRITLDKPADKTLTGDTTPTFSWKKASSAVTGYEFQISPDASFQGAAIVQVPGMDTLSYTPAALAYNSRFYWRVRSYITSGAETYQSAWSVRRVLYTTIDITGIAPYIEPDLYENTLRPTIAWNEVPNALSYRVQISSSETKWTTPFLNVNIKAPNATSAIPTSWRHTTDLPRARTMYARILVQGAYGYSIPSPVIPVPLGNPPAVPGLRSPTSGAVIGNVADGVTFSWYRPSSWRTIPAVSYELQIATASDFSEGLLEYTIDDNGTAIQFTDPAIDGLSHETAYFWRLRAVGDDGISAWSSVLRFYTTPPVPDGLDAIVDSLRPSYNWTPVDLARAYKVQVAKVKPTATDPVQNFVTGNIWDSLTVTASPPVVGSKTLPRNTDMVFRVSAGGVYGYSAWSEPFEFTTPNSPNVPVQNSPTNGANINTFMPMMDWRDSERVKNNPDSDASGYQIQIAKDWTEFNKQTPTLILDEETTISQLRLAPDALPTAGTYYWRVRAFNGMGEYSIWSSVRSFTTPAMISGLVMDALESLEMAGATLQVSNVSLQVQSTGDGTYAIRGLMPGTYTLTATNNGFMRQSVSFAVGYGTNLTRNFNLVSVPEDGQIHRRQLERRAFRYGRAPVAAADEPGASLQGQPGRYHR